MDSVCFILPTVLLTAQNWNVWAAFTYHVHPDAGSGIMDSVVCPFIPTNPRRNVLRNDSTC